MASVAAGPQGCDSSVMWASGMTVSEGDVTRKVRLIGVGALAALVLIAGGVFVAIRLVANRVDRTITQADLFGTPAARPVPRRH